MSQASAPRPGLAILIAVTATGPLALNIFIPSMPGIQQVFATDYATVQLTLTLYLAATAIAQLFVGPLSDRFGRRPVILGGMLLYTLGSLMAVAAQAISTLIMARVVQAVGGCTGMALSRAILRDLHDQDTAASRIAYVTMAMVIAPMLAPAAGGWLDEQFGWRASFWVLVILGVLVLVWALRALHETHFQHRPLPGPAGLIGDYLRLLRFPVFLGPAATLAFSSGMFFAFLAGAPYIMVNLMDRSPAEYGLFFIVISLGYMSGNFLSGRLSRRLGSERMIAVGCALALIGATLLVLLSGVMQPLALFGPMVLITFSNGLTIPNATAAAVSARPGMFGSASGLAGFLQIAVGALMTLIVGALQPRFDAAMAVIILASGLLALVFFLGSRDRPQAPPV
ncbi:MAG: multidrug effflux MFS transporter [Candidatus Competibacterales bacterium]|nr:multidrug effflux MFS transporter [Candidatus Competibacterales bacterium]